MTRLCIHEHPQIQSSTPCESEERDRLKTSNRRIMHNRQQRHIQPPSRDCEQCCCSTHHPNCGDRARSSPSPIHTHTPSPNIDRVRFCICIDSVRDIHRGGVCAADLPAALCHHSLVPDPRRWASEIHGRHSAVLHANKTRGIHAMEWMGGAGDQSSHHLIRISSFVF